ncbi:hypothetical protein MtrunA17_Chr4g0062501 [Medicago truncatula]|uniref:Uncharacterized protein n=1 Tax=Medicago truncatula TaxID=3880 RepID=A0A396IJ09_MEDTR|nr:hypothetical protein MtrunA17_Chr4g0062501 [Medicago truncatula]
MKKDKLYKYRYTVSLFSVNKSYSILKFDKHNMPNTYTHKLHTPNPKETYWVWGFFHPVQKRKFYHKINKNKIFIKNGNTLIVY